jgi:hypothetical protein
MIKKEERERKGEMKLSCLIGCLTRMRSLSYLSPFPNDSVPFLLVQAASQLPKC